ncbi:MAG: hypothetical protein RMM53_10565 [Bacteroidia bacterium]|nr:hypothetical protein [Bacteroidia bacterium]
MDSDNGPMNFNRMGMVRLAAMVVRAAAFVALIGRADGQGIYRGGVDDGYDSISLELKPTSQKPAVEDKGFPSVWRPGQKIDWVLRQKATLLDAAGRTAAVFEPGEEPKIPPNLPEGVYFFVYRGEGRRVWVREN